jgi:hypothetical protein
MLFASCMSHVKRQSHKIILGMLTPLAHIAFVHHRHCCFRLLPGCFLCSLECLNFHSCWLLILHKRCLPLQLHIV